MQDSRDSMDISTNQYFFFYKGKEIIMLHKGKLVELRNQSSQNSTTDGGRANPVSPLAEELLTT